MTSHNNKLHRKLFRGAAQKSDAHLLFALGTARSRAGEDDYSSLISTFRSSAPLISSRFFRGGQSNYRDLVWQRPIPTLSIEKELIWASHWLPLASGAINKTRAQHDELEQLVLCGRYQDAVKIVDKHINEFGWSFWGAELFFALTQQIEGTEAQRSLSVELQRRAHTRLSGLFAHIFSDRNDEGFSYDAFYAKCNDSFSRFPDKWMQEYLFYRALSHIQYGETSLTQVMVCDMSSSVIDYYETCLDICQRICTDPSLLKFKGSAEHLMRELINAGVIDVRLHKLLRMLDPKILSGSFFYTKYDKLNVSNYLREFLTTNHSVDNSGVVGFDKDIDSFYASTLSDLQSIERLGCTAQDEQLRQLKWGVNFKSISAAQSLAAHCAYRSNSPITGVLVTPYLYITSSQLSIEDALCLSDEAAYSLLCSIRTSSDLSPKDRDLLNTALDVIAGESVDSFTSQPRLLTVWVARHLIRLGRFPEASKICDALNAFGGYWSRQSAKLTIMLLSKQGLLEKALELCLDWILIDSRYSFELPLELIFENRRAAEFKEFDPVLVGIVSHYAFHASKKTSIHYLCKAACRRFFTSGFRADLAGQWGRFTVQENPQKLIVFLREIWIDENLALIDSFDTTQSVRREQIEVLQQLIQWDCENQAIYANSIRELTFDETLWRGLQQINETRVFVNEPAITRWALNELLPDFERWRRIRNSNSDVIVESGVVREYLLDPQIETILKSMEHRSITEADTLLLQITERLYRKFLTDPTDGLDCFLSLRVRHGSLKGTLLGPIEEQSLLLADEGAEEHFVARWGCFLALEHEEFANLLTRLRVFSKAVIDVANYAKNERVQIQSSFKPHGAVLPCLNPQIITTIFSVVERDIGVSNFINLCYGVFWIALRLPMQDLAQYFRGEVKDKLRAEFDDLILDIQSITPTTLPLVTSLRSIATTVQSQCEIVAAWFEPAEEKEHSTYTLLEAIEIAKQATKNVYRAFPAQVEIHDLPGDDLPLSSSALGTLTDCLYVIFENSWKHSGIDAQCEPLKLSADFDQDNNILTFNVCSCIESDKYRELVSGRLDILKRRYLFDGADSCHAALEGGSGFAKLARMTRTIDKSIIQQPLDFGVTAPSSWFVRVSIPLYKRESSYDAYQ